MGPWCVRSGDTVLSPFLRRCRSEPHRPDARPRRGVAPSGHTGADSAAPGPVVGGLTEDDQAGRLRPAAGWRADLGQRRAGRRLRARCHRHAPPGEPDPGPGGGGGGRPGRGDGRPVRRRRPDGTREGAGRDGARRSTGGGAARRTGMGSGRSRAAGRRGGARGGAAAGKGGGHPLPGRGGHGVPSPGGAAPSRPHRGPLVPDRLVPGPAGTTLVPVGPDRGGRPHHRAAPQRDPTLYGTPPSDAQPCASRSPRPAPLTPTRWCPGACW